jgi:hypothetical protein
LSWPSRGWKRASNGCAAPKRQAGVNYNTIKQYGSVADAFEFCDRSQNLTFTHHLPMAAEVRTGSAFEWSMRIDNLTFYHHRYAMAVEGFDARLEWLRRAEAALRRLTDLLRQSVSSRSIRAGLAGRGGRASARTRPRTAQAEAGL